MIQVSVRPGEN